MKETPEWPEKRLAEYYNALVDDGINAERNFSTCMPGDPWDPLTYWYFGNGEYTDVLNRRMKLIKERDLTEIVVLQPYRGHITDGEARWIIRLLKPFMPNVIFEPINEPVPSDVERIKRIVEILIEEGIPIKNIMLEYVEAGAWSDFILAGLYQEVLISRHWIGSMKTIDTIFAGSTAQTILSWGNFVGSCDGPDQMQDAHGLNFRYIQEHQPPTEDDWSRPNNEELKKVTTWEREKGRGGEMLSASGYRQPLVNKLSRLNMGDAINLGHEERLAMKEG